MSTILITKKGIQKVTGKEKQGVKRLRSEELVKELYSKYSDVIQRKTPDVTSKENSLFSFVSLKDLNLKGGNNKVSLIKGLQFDARGEKRAKPIDYVSLAFVTSLELLVLLETGRIVKVLSGSDKRNLEKSPKNSLCYYDFTIVDSKGNRATRLHPELVKKHSNKK